MVAARAPSPFAALAALLLAALLLCSQVSPSDGRAPSTAKRRNRARGLRETSEKPETEASSAKPTDGAATTLATAANNAGDGEEVSASAVAVRSAPTEGDDGGAAVTNANAAAPTDSSDAAAAIANGNANSASAASSSVSGASVSASVASAEADASAGAHSRSEAGGEDDRSGGAEAGAAAVASSLAESAEASHSTSRDASGDKFLTHGSYFERAKPGVPIEHGISSIANANAMNAPISLDHDNGNQFSLHKRPAGLALTPSNSVPDTHDNMLLEMMVSPDCSTDLGRTKLKIACTPIGPTLNFNPYFHEKPILLKGPRHSFLSFKSKVHTPTDDDIVALNPAQGNDIDYREIPIGDGVPEQQYQVPNFRGEYLNPGFLDYGPIERDMYSPWFPPPQPQFIGQSPVPGLSGPVPQSQWTPSIPNANAMLPNSEPQSPMQLCKSHSNDKVKELGNTVNTHNEDYSREDSIEAYRPTSPPVLLYVTPETSHETISSGHPFEENIANANAVGGGIANANALQGGAFSNGDNVANANAEQGSGYGGEGSISNANALGYLYGGNVANANAVGRGSIANANALDSGFGEGFPGNIANANTLTRFGSGFGGNVANANSVSPDLEGTYRSGIANANAVGFGDRGEFGGNIANANALGRPFGGLIGNVANANALGSGLKGEMTGENAVRPTHEQREAMHINEDYDYEYDVGPSLSIPKPLGVGQVGQPVSNANALNVGFSGTFGGFGGGIGNANSLGYGSEYGDGLGANANDIGGGYGSGFGSGYNGNIMGNAFLGAFRNPFGESIANANALNSGYGASAANANGMGDFGYGGGYRDNIANSNINTLGIGGYIGEYGGGFANANSLGGGENYGNEFGGGIANSNALGGEEVFNGGIAHSNALSGGVGNTNTLGLEGGYGNGFGGIANSNAEGVGGYGGGIANANSVSGGGIYSGETFGNANAVGKGEYGINVANANAYGGGGYGIGGNIANSNSFEGEYGGDVSNSNSFHGVGDDFRGGFRDKVDKFNNVNGFESGISENIVGGGYSDGNADSVASSNAIGGNEFAVSSANTNNFQVGGNTQGMGGAIANANSFGSGGYGSGFGGSIANANAVGGNGAISNANAMGGTGYNAGGIANANAGGGTEFGGSVANANALGGIANANAVGGGGSGSVANANAVGGGGNNYRVNVGNSNAVGPGFGSVANANAVGGGSASANAVKAFTNVQFGGRRKRNILASNLESNLLESIRESRFWKGNSFPSTSNHVKKPTPEKSANVNSSSRHIEENITDRYNIQSKENAFKRSFPFQSMEIREIPYKHILYDAEKYEKNQKIDNHEKGMQVENTEMNPHREHMMLGLFVEQPFTEASSVITHAERTSNGESKMLTPRSRSLSRIFAARMAPLIRPPLGKPLAAHAHGSATLAA